jgi:hypothetical protein
VDDKLKQLMKEKFKTSLALVTTSTPAIHAGVTMPQIQSQPGLVTQPTLISQHP